MLKYKLVAADLFDKNSNYKILATIEHENNFYITNIDNTSDRNNIDSTLK